MDWFAVTEAERRLLYDALDEHGITDAPTRTLVFQVYACGSLWRHGEEEIGWVVIPRNAKLQMRRDGQYPDADRAVESGILEERVFADGKTYSRAEGRAKEYRITEELADRLAKAAQENLEGPYVNLFTGKRTRRKLKTEKRDASGNRYTSLVCKGMETRSGLIDFESGLLVLRAERKESERARAEVKASEERVERLKRRYTEAEDVPEIAAEVGAQLERAVQEHEEIVAAYRKAWGIYLHDLSCLRTIRRHSTKQPDGLYLYREHYRVQMSGRISAKGGALQGASRRMKEALTKGVPGIRNYDLVSSQGFILLEMFERASVECPWLKRYLSNPNAKREYAARIGLSVDAWKTCLCAVFMGGYLPKDIEASEGEVARAIREDVGRANLVETYRKLRSEIAPLYEAIQQWHEWLDTVWKEKEKYPAGRGWYVKNDVNMPLRIDTPEMRKPHKRRARLAAFVLQGREAQFIHTLKLELDRRGVGVISNQHDGLVTMGEIPEEAVQRTKEKTGMEYARLEEKPFV